MRNRPWVWFLAIAAAVALWPAGTPAAAGTTNGPHGSYATNTDACAQCHNTHAAPTANLIAFTPAAGTENDVYRTCVYCHDGSQSKYDVKAGAIRSADGNTYAAAGGGFDSVVAIEGPTGSALLQLVPTTSAHDAKVTTEVYAPGGSQVAGGGWTLSCSSCHDPHGTRNSRQLVESVATRDPAGNAVTRTVGAGVQGTVANPLGKEQVAWTGIDTFCQACHWDYYQTAAGSGDTNTGVYSSARRHRVGMVAGGDPGKPSGYDSAKAVLPLVGGNVSCITCHRVHGTAAMVSNQVYARGSTLLRLDGRGVCQNCHNRLADPRYPTLVDLDTVLAGTQALSPTTNTIVVRFGTYVLPVYGTGNANGANNAANYTVTGGVSNPAIVGAALQPDGKSVVLTTSAPIAAGATYTVTVLNVVDLNGNAIPATGATGNAATFTR